MLIVYLVCMIVQLLVVFSWAQRAEHSRMKRNEV